MDRYRVMQGEKFIGVFEALNERDAKNLAAEKLGYLDEKDMQKQTGSSLGFEVQWIPSRGKWL